MLKLRKALYGLVEAPKLWYDTLRTDLLKMDFKVTKSEPCFFVMNKERGGRQQIVIMGIFVDDILCFGACSEMVKEVKAKLSTRFKVKDLGDARWVLGMRVQQLQGKITIDQENYKNDILNRFEDEIKDAMRSKPKTPLPAKLDLRKAQDHEALTEKPYRELIDSLAHLMTGTRPDIAYAVSWLSRHLAKPAERHWAAAVHVLKCL